MSHIRIIGMYKHLSGFIPSEKDKKIVIVLKKSKKKELVIYFKEIRSDSLKQNEGEMKTKKINTDNFDGEDDDDNDDKILESNRITLKRLNIVLSLRFSKTNSPIIKRLLIKICSLFFSLFFC